MKKPTDLNTRQCLEEGLPIATEFSMDNPLPPISSPPSSGSGTIDRDFDLDSYENMATENTEPVFRGFGESYEGEEEVDDLDDIYAAPRGPKMDPRLRMETLAAVLPSTRFNPGLYGSEHFGSRGVNIEEHPSHGDNNKLQFKQASFDIDNYPRQTFKASYMTLPSLPKMPFTTPKMRRKKPAKAFGGEKNKQKSNKNNMSDIKSPLKTLRASLSLTLNSTFNSRRKMTRSKRMSSHVSDTNTLRSSIGINPPVVDSTRSLLPMNIPAPTTTNTTTNNNNNEQPTPSVSRRRTFKLFGR